MTPIPRTTPPPLPKVLPPLTKAEPAAGQPRAASGHMPSAPSPRPGRRRSVLKRAVLGLVLLFLLAGGSAVLLHASIDPVEEASPAAAEANASQRE